jgi:hypothetical protein
MNALPSIESRFSQKLGEAWAKAGQASALGADFTTSERR